MLFTIFNTSNYCFPAYYVSSPQVVKWTEFLAAAGFKPEGIESQPRKEFIYLRK